MWGKRRAREIYRFSAAAARRVNHSSRFRSPPLADVVLEVSWGGAQLLLPLGSLQGTGSEFIIISLDSFRCFSGRFELETTGCTGCSSVWHRCWSLFPTQLCRRSFCQGSSWHEISCSLFCRTWSLQESWIAFSVLGDWRLVVVCSNILPPEQIAVMGCEQGPGKVSKRSRRFSIRAVWTGEWWRSCCPGKSCSCSCGCISSPALSGMICKPEFLCWLLFSDPAKVLEQKFSIAADGVAVGVLNPSSSHSSSSQASSRFLLRTKRPAAPPLDLNGSAASWNLVTKPSSNCSRPLELEFSSWEYGPWCRMSITPNCGSFCLRRIIPAALDSMIYSWWVLVDSSRGWSGSCTSAGRQDTNRKPCNSFADSWTSILQSCFFQLGGTAVLVPISPSLARKESGVVVVLATAAARSESPIPEMGLSARFSRWCSAQVRSESAASFSNCACRRRSSVLPALRTGSRRSRSRLHDGSLKADSIMLQQQQQQQQLPCRSAPPVLWDFLRLLLFLFLSCDHWAVFAKRKSPAAAAVVAASLESRSK